MCGPRVTKRLRTITENPDTNKGILGGSGLLKLPPAMTKWAARKGVDCTLPLGGHKDIKGLFEGVLPWVDRKTIQADLVVQMRGCGPAAVPDQSNLVSALDTSPPFDQAFL